MAHEVPALPYDYNALEPHIDEQTMHLHHDKHHQAYVDKLNKALEDHDEWAKLSVEDLLRRIDEVPDEIAEAIRDHGGGHANHSMFWKVMSPNGGGEPTGEVATLIAKQWGGFDKFKQEFSETAKSVFGSGWAFLIVNEDGELEIVGTQNQDSPLMDQLTPILGLDVWEHGYYLKYQNKRADYITAWWNVVNWEQVEENWQASK